MRRSFRRAALLLSLILGVVAAPSLASTAWTPLGPYGGTVWSVVVDPLHSRVVYAVAPGLGVFKSLDRGDSWQRLAAAPTDCVALAIDPVRPQTLYAASLWVYKSTDGGIHWTLASQGLPGPFVTRALAVDPANPNRLYLGTLERGLWRSRDGGASWQPASQGLPDGEETEVTTIAVPPRPSGVAFAATRHGLYKTLSHGASWEPTSLPDERVTALATAPSDPWTVYAAMGSTAIARSTDRGASWTWPGIPLPRPGAINSLAVDPRSSRVLYAGTDIGLFKSTNAGRSWLPIGPGRPPFVAGITLDPGSPDTVYAALYSMGSDIGGVLRSFDAGRRWVRRNQGLDGLFLTAAAVDSGNPDRLLAGMNNSGLFLSPNQGERWARSPLAVPRESLLLNVQSLAASPDTPGAFVAIAYPGNLVWKTTDGGRSWSGYSNFRTTWGVARFDPSHGDTFFVMNRQGIFRGTLAGSSLTSVSTLPLGCSMGDLLVTRGASSGPPVIYAAGGGSTDGSVSPRCTTPTRSQVVRSTDGGATWSAADAGLPGEWVSGLSADPEDPEVLYARIGSDILGPTHGHGVWKTVDGGATWRQAGGELGDQQVSALAVLPGRVYAATAADGKVFRSDDGGEHWQERGEGLPSLWVLQLLADPATPGRVYAATSKGLWRLDDEL